MLSMGCLLEREADLSAEDPAVLAAAEAAAVAAPVDVAASGMLWNPLYSLKSAGRFFSMGIAC